MSHGKRNSGYTVPTGRPFLLREMHEKLATVHDRMRGLDTSADPLEFDELADELYAVFRTASNLAPPKSATGCALHPNGPVDPLAPEGWSQCLYCNGNQRRGGDTTPPTGQRQNLGYPVPGPPYTFGALDERLHRVNDLVHTLALTSSSTEFAQVADLLHEAFVVARELSRARNRSGCPRHPGAPVDMQAADGPQCLFCHGEKLREQQPFGTTAALPGTGRRARRPAVRRSLRPGSAPDRRREA